MSQNIILLCLPIISTIKCLLHKSPISLRCSTSISIIRSKPGCVIDSTRPLFKCFLKSIQKLGAVIGLGLLCFVRHTNGRLALADKVNRYCPSFVLNVISNSSVSGCAILYILLPSSVSFNSCVILAITIPSSAIVPSMCTCFYMFQVCV